MEKTFFISLVAIAAIIATAITLSIYLENQFEIECVKSG
jgi:hypothetical protein